MTDADESVVPPLPSAIRKSSEYFSVGRDFYDDKYADDGSEEEASIEDTLDFSQPFADLRRDELQALHKAYDLIRSRNSQGNELSKSNRSQSCPICMVKGPSGSGKSTVFAQFASEVEQQALMEAKEAVEHESKAKERAPLVLKGKFEELSGENPLSALVEAFAGVATHLKTVVEESGGEYDELRRLRESIIRNLGGRQAAADLASMIPALSPLLLPMKANKKSTEVKTIEDKPSSVGSTKKTESLTDVTSNASRDDKSQHTISTTDPQIPTKSNNEHAWNRLKFMLQAMMQAICSSSDRPCILFIDDLQWADTGTLELLEILLLDNLELPNLMFVGCYRSDHKLADAFWKLLEKATDNGSTITLVEVNNLTLEGMTSYLKQTLRLNSDEEGENERVGEFAAVLHEKTEGNIFFARQILEELHTKGWLSFCRVTFTWEWDLRQIEVSDNVLDAVAQRIETNCSQMLQMILTTAAYMRSTVDADSLMLAIDLDSIRKPDSGDSDFKPIKLQLIEELDKAVTSGFLSNMTGSNMYSFAHDRIKEAAYNMIEEGPTRNKFRRKIANRLYRLSKDRRLGRDWMVYSAADHFNATPLSDALFLANVNLDAGKRCVKVAAFQGASKYLGHALGYLDGTGDTWTYHYKMTLEIHALKAEVELLLGNLEEGKRIADILFDNARTRNDKLRTQVELAKALGRRESHVESFEFSRRTLRLMNYYPKTTAGVVFAFIRDLMYIRRYFRNHTDEEILSLARQDDPTLSSVMELYHMAMYQAFFCGNVVEFLSSIMKSIRVTLKEGILQTSGLAVMAYFMFCDNLGDQEGAYRFANLGLAMLDEQDDKTPLCLQLGMKTVFLDSWSTEVQPVVDNFNRSYKLGMEVGDFMNGLMCRSAAIEHQFSAGFPLAVLDVQFADCVAKEKLYSVETYKESTLAKWSTVQYLRGSCEDAIKTPSPLPFDAERKLDLSAYDSNAIAKMLQFRSLLQIGVYWNNCEFLERLLENVVPTQDKSHLQQGIRLPFLAIAYGTLSQRGKKRRKHYLKKGRACLLELKKLSEMKGMNSWHRYVLAAAHLEVFAKGRKNRGSISPSNSVRQYERAIEVALNRDHKQDAALGAQLLVEHLLWNYSEPDTALIEKHIGIAIRLYKDWGAANLVRHLEHKYTQYLHSAHDVGAMEKPSVEIRTRASIENTLVEEDSMFGGNRTIQIKKLGSATTHTLVRDDVSALTDQ